MSSRKEEERNEKIIRGLMKLPPNRRCINCNSLGPQYVCTNFWTFICMTCSGIHREFTHRVKSVSMSKFTSQEVEALQEGGNQRARETFLKDWDPRGQRLPDNSNVDKVREFIKSVYVDKKFFASKASGKPPRDILNTRNHEDETRRASSYHSYSQSPPYDYQYEERRYGKQAPALTKKPGSDRGMFRFMSTSRLSDHGQDDGFANEVPNARVSDFSVSSAGDPFRSDTQSPTCQRDFGFSSPKRDPDQVTGSSGSTVQLSGDDTGFKSADSVDKHFIGPTPEQSVVTQHPHPSFSHSSESGKFDGLDLFSLPYAPQSSTSLAPEQSVVTQHNKDSLPSVSHLSESGKFDGLDLFSAPYAPQSTTSAPSAIDLFELSATSSALSINTLQPPRNSVASTLSVNQQFQAFEPSSLDLFAVMPQQQSSETLKDKSPGMITQENQGWATFDMPWHVEPSQGIKSSIVVSETSTSDDSVGKFDQALSVDKSSHWSFHQDFSASGPSPLMHNPWHGGLHDLGDPLNAKNNQSWSSFEESTTSFESIYIKTSEQVPVQDPSGVDVYLPWEISENVKMKEADLDTRPAPFLSTTPHAIGSVDSSIELPVMDGAQSHGLDTKSRNPFDFPSDADLESSNMFLDMSSLQSAIPNHSISTPWFPESAAIPYTPGKSQDALVYLAGQAPSMQIQNIHGQGPVASVSGNPFG
ncbi:probable ADP-ribosylation factor GTPase-activating protein AGD14 isoform X2 [Cynara cardunculus var. scolymus]|uniref:probable ADP-ribosylation factor GTPase-activating protein AGD14 isoform X2 n=1 Tax=Cynara cardunculus var. scolymus TaxID=59895 RepID=UPI000D623D83|nr:probable ADP-ribosylation factor GTPase-activating protein AGD14 isoform X2 [Cynara cardunculus var. scolymus]